MPAPRSAQEAQRILQDSLAKFAAESRALLIEAAHHKKAPGRLFHFTDVHGLVGILVDGAIWAPMAAAASDRSEMRHSIRLLEKEVTDGSLTSDVFPRDWLLNELTRRESAFDHEIEPRAYFASFCGAAEGSHWLHYGRQGRGVAIEFSDALVVAANRLKFDLLPVIYERDRHRALVTSLFRAADEHCRSLLHVLEPVGDQVRALSLDSLLNALQFLHAKHEAFQSESEWRLAMIEMLFGGHPAVPPSPTNYRVASDRVIPYKKIAFPKEAISGIVLGADCPMKNNDRALAQLMFDTLGRQVAVTRSPIDLRL